MKRRHKLLATVIALSTFGLSSCDSFLEEQVFSFPDGKVLFENADNLEMALTGVYDVLTAPNIDGHASYALFGLNIHLMTQLGCDEVIGRTDKIAFADFKPFCTYSYNSESRYLADVWFALYAGIYRANNIIQYAPAVDADVERKEQIIAEARFMRGFYYFYLTSFFGGVPLPLTPDADPMAPRESLLKVYDVIMADFRHAYEKLPQRNIYASRVNKYTAAGMLAKAYLYLAACKENGVGAGLNFALNAFDWVDASACYGQALELCKDIVNTGGYVLHDNYRYLFMADNTPLKASQINECLMIAPFGKDASRYYFFQRFTGPAGNVNTNGGGAGWFPAMGELAQLYNAKDVRFAQNIGGALATATETVEGVQYYVPVKLYGSGSNIFLTKFRQSAPASRMAAGIPAYLSVLNLPILRYADVLLMYAEAAYKTGDEATAREQLKAIRTRAAGGNTALADELTAAYNKADFMDELKDERSRELCGEGWRRHDLIRWGKLQSVVENLKTANTDNLTPNVYYYNMAFAQTVKDNFRLYKIWYPIPKREREVNVNLVPNPGWEQ